MERKKSYCIIKKLILPNGREANIILVDNQGEIWELDSKAEANELAELLTINSDSGWKYIVRGA